MRLIIDDVWVGLTGWQETRGQPFEGKRGFCEIVRNRTRLRFQSDGTVVGTLLHPGAFSCWNTKDPNRTKAARIEADDPEYLDVIAAWKLSGEPDRLLPLDAVFYMNEKTVLKLYGKLPDWAHEGRKVAVIGAHSFFTV